MPAIEIPAALAADADLSDSAKSLYLYMRRVARTGVCWMTQRRLARALHTSKATVCRRVNELYEAGWVDKQTRRTRKGRQNVYLLADERQLTEGRQQAWRKGFERDCIEYWTKKAEDDARRLEQLTQNEEAQEVDSAPSFEGGWYHSWDNLRLFHVISRFEPTGYDGGIPLSTYIPFNPEYIVRIPYSSLTTTTVCSEDEQKPLFDERRHQGSGVLRRDEETSAFQGLTAHLHVLPTVPLSSDLCSASFGIDTGFCLSYDSFSSRNQQGCLVHTCALESSPSVQESGRNDPRHPSGKSFSTGRVNIARAEERPAGSSCTPPTPRRSLYSDVYGPKGRGASSRSFSLNSDVLSHTGSKISSGARFRRACRKELWEHFCLLMFVFFPKHQVKAKPDKWEAIHANNLLRFWDWDVLRAKWAISDLFCRWDDYWSQESNLAKKYRVPSVQMADSLKKWSHGILLEGNGRPMSEDPYELYKCLEEAWVLQDRPGELPIEKPVPLPPTKAQQALQERQAEVWKWRKKERMRSWKQLVADHGEFQEKLKKKGWK